jgi:hypothetical protein
MTRRSLALGSLLGGSLIALAVAWSNAWVGQDLPRALALVALAGAVLILVLRARGRRFVGALLAVLGLGIALAGALLPVGPATPWRIGYAAGGVVLTVGGLLTMITGGRWPAPADRFQRRVTGTTADSGDPTDLWRAMDAGLDPTVDPDVRKGDPGDTMRSANQSRRK